MIRGCRLLAPRRTARVLTQCCAVAIALTSAVSCGDDDGSGVPVAQSIALTTGGSPTLNVGQSLTVYVHASDANGTRIPAFSGVTFESSNPTVASVTKTDTSATVTGLSVGETVITATVRSGVAAQLTVRVGSVPIIGLSPTAAAFTGYRGLVVAPQTITITNTGSGTLSSLAATTSVPWLQVSFVDGVTTANPTATLRLQPSTATLADGTHSANVTVSSTVAGVVPRSVAVTFHVAAGPVAFKIVAVSAPSQSGSAGKPVSQPPSVIVRAADDTPVAGVPVTFTVSGGGGAITPSGVVNTNVDGIATLTSWTLGSQPGALQTVTASSPGLAGSPITFTATALAASKIAKVSGDNQTTVLGRPLPQPVVVLVTDPNDVPVPNASVTFSPSAGGSVAPVAATTDASGRATATWTLGPTEGTQSVVASLVGPPGSPSVSFTATATGATSIVKVSGDLQQGPAGSALPQPLKVRVTGANDQPVTGVVVTFTTDGTANPPSATTDANGETSTRWTLPPSVGGKSLIASISTTGGPRSVSFNATATTPPPSGIVVVDGNNQSGQAGSALPRQVVVRVVTSIGSTVPGVTVTFTPGSGAGQSFSPTSGTTNASGELRTTWTLGATLGSYTATVSSPGLPSASISATASQVAPNAGLITGAAAKAPDGAAPSASDQAVVSYSGPSSGQVSLSGSGTFNTPIITPGTYTLSVSSQSGAFPTTVVYGVSVPGGQTTSVGTIPIARPGTGSIHTSVHACTQVGDGNGTATVRLYSGLGGDQGGSLVRSWTIPFGVFNEQTSVAYGVYTLTITANPTDPTKSCAVYRTTVVHSALTTGSTTAIPLVTLANP